MSKPSGGPRPRAVKTTYLLFFAAKCAAVAALVFAAFAVAMLLALDVDLPESYHEIGAAVDAATARMAYVVVPAAAVCAALVAAGCALVGIRASHKIAGPVYRLAADLRRMAGGDYDFVVATRSKDQLKGMAQELEKARSALRSRLVRVEKCARQLAEAAEADQPSADELGRHLSLLEYALSQGIPQQEAGS